MSVADTWTIEFTAGGAMVSPEVGCCSGWSIGGSDRDDVVVTDAAAMISAEASKDGNCCIGIGS